LWTLQPHHLRTLLAFGRVDEGGGSVVDIADPASKTLLSLRGQQASERRREKSSLSSSILLFGEGAGGWEEVKLVGFLFLFFSVLFFGGSLAIAMMMSKLHSIPHSRTQTWCHISVPGGTFPFHMSGRGKCITCPRYVYIVHPNPDPNNFVLVLEMGSG
jgi:hypothetical protein